MQMVLSIEQQRAWQKCRHFGDEIFKCIFFNEYMKFDYNSIEVCSRESN